MLCVRLVVVKQTCVRQVVLSVRQVIPPGGTYSLVHVLVSACSAPSDNCYRTVSVNLVISANFTLRFIIITIIISIIFIIIIIMIIIIIVIIIAIIMIIVHMA